MEIEVTFRNKRNLKLKGIVHKPQKFQKAAIILHGLLGTKEHRIPRELARFFEKNNVLAFRFDFNGSGDSEGLLEQKTISSEVEDIGSAVDFIEEEYGITSIILVGHSSGSIDAALYAHKDCRIKKLILLSGVGDLKSGVKYDFSDKEVQLLKTQGYIELKKEGRWYSNQKISRAFYDEYFELDPLKELSKYNGRTLIIHGEEDETVPSDKDPIDLFEAAKDPKKLIILKGAGHQLSEGNSWQELIDTFKKELSS